MEFFEASYAPDLADPRAMPILGDIAASPPTVIVTAGLDPLRDSGRAYAAELARAGIDHVFLEIRGVTHSFANLRQAVPGAQEDLERVLDAVRYMLARSHSGEA